MAMNGILPRSLPYWPCGEGLGMVFLDREGSGAGPVGFPASQDRQRLIALGTLFGAGPRNVAEVTPGSLFQLFVSRQPDHDVRVVQPPQQSRNHHGIRLSIAQAHRGPAPAGPDE